MADEVWRAWGILRSARLLKAEEVMELGSSLRLGVAVGLIDSVGLATVNRLLVVTQPGHLKYVKGGASADERDALRADIVRRELATHAVARFRSAQGGWSCRGRGTSRRV